MSSTDVTTYHYALVDRREDNQPTDCTSTLAELGARLEQHGRDYGDKNGPGFLPATFGGGRRANEDVESVHWLALDMEDTEGTINDLQGPLAGCQRIVYSTWSHGDRRKWSAGHPRFRVLVPYTRPVDPDEHRAIFAHIVDVLDGAPDGATKDPARLMYTPRRRNPEAEIDPWVTVHDDGPALDPEALPDGDGGTVAVEDLLSDTDAQTDTSHDGPEDLDDAPWVYDALKAIPPDGCDCDVCHDYETWRNVGIALRSTFGDDAFDVFDAWSQRGDKYPGATKCRQLWDSFPDQPAEDVQTGDGITLGTLRHLASEHGARLPESAYPGWQRPSMLDPYEGHERSDLDVARTKVGEAVDTLLGREAGRMYLVGDPGTGKSYAAHKAALKVYNQGGTVKYVTSTNDVLREQRQSLLDDHARADDDIRINTFHDRTAVKPRRTDETCSRLDVVTALDRMREKGGSEFCKGCDLHPDQGGDCPFIRKRRDFRGRDTQIVFTTTEDEIRTGRTPWHQDDVERDEVVDWTWILEAFLGADETFAPDRFVGIVERTNKQYRLTVDEDRDNGHSGPELVEGEDYRLDDDGPSPTSAGKRRILEWFADTAPVPIAPNRNEVFGYYRRERMQPAYDLLILDESVLGSLHTAIPVTLEDIQQWNQHDDLGFEVGSDGLEAMNKAFGKVRPDDSAAVEPLADWLPHNLEATGNDTGDRLLEQALEGTTGDGELVEAAEDAPEWRAIDLLAYWSKRDWYGCYLRFNDQREVVELVLPHVQSPDLEQADRILALDATGDSVAAEALLGPDHDYVTAYVERPDDTIVQRVDWQLTHWSLSDLDVARHKALVSAPEFRESKHLHICRKAHNPDVDDEWRRGRAPDEDTRSRWRDHTRMLLGADLDHIIHVGGTKTRGSNEFEDCTSVTLASYYLPSGPIRQRAAVLRMLTDRSEDDCERAAVWQLEGAEYVQAAHRTRLLQGGTTVTYCDGRIIPGLEPDTTTDREGFDALTALSTGHLGDYQHDRVAAILLRELVEQADGAVAARDLRNLPPEGGGSRDGLTSYIGPLCEVRPLLDPPDVRRALAGAFQNRWQHNMRTAAKAANLSWGTYTTSAGGREKYVLASDPADLDRESIREAARCVEGDCAWIEVDGQRFWSDGHLEDLRAAVEAIEDDAFLELSSQNKMAERLAETDHLGSSGTATRRIRKAGGPEAVKAMWRRMHRPAPSPDNEAVAERAAMMEIHGGLSRDEALRRSRDRVEAADPPSDPPWGTTGGESHHRRKAPGPAALRC